MGAWGYGSFENDDALDWLHALEGTRDETVVRTALANVAGAAADDYVQAPEAACAVAAAEVVAAAAGAPAPNLPDEVPEWLAEGAATVPPEWSELARHSVMRVREKSELRELWDEAGARGWLESTADLLERLGGTPYAPRDSNTGDRDPSANRSHRYELP
jgi:hypothetical protein